MSGQTHIRRTFLGDKAAGSLESGGSTTLSFCRYRIKPCAAQGGVADGRHNQLNNYFKVRTGPRRAPTNKCRSTMGPRRAPTKMPGREGGGELTDYITHPQPEFESELKSGGGTRGFASLPPRVCLPDRLPGSPSGITTCTTERAPLPPCENRKRLSLALSNIQYPISNSLLLSYV